MFRAPREATIAPENLYQLSAASAHVDSWREQHKSNLAGDRLLLCGGFARLKSIGTALSHGGTIGSLMLVVRLPWPPHSIPVPVMTFQYRLEIIHWQFGGFGELVYKGPVSA